MAGGGEPSSPTAPPPPPAPSTEWQEEARRRAEVASTTLDEGLKQVVKGTLRGLGAVADASSASVAALVHVVDEGQVGASSRVLHARTHAHARPLAAVPSHRTSLSSSGGAAPRVARCVCMGCMRDAGNDALACRGTCGKHALVRRRQRMLRCRV